MTWFARRPNLYVRNRLKESNLPPKPATDRRDRRSEGEAAEAVRAAFRERAGHAIDQIARAAPIAALTDALAAPTDLGAVARALRDPTAFQPALSLDPLADALARGVHERERLAARAGGLLSAEDIGRALGGISRQAVDKRRRAHQLLGVKLASDWRYPAMQVGDDGEILAGLPEVLAELEELSPWAILDFLLAEDAALGGVTPLGALRLGGDGAASVLRIAKASKSDAFS